MSEGRPSSARRGYDANWRKRRDEQLRRQPWCELCVERVFGPSNADPLGVLTTAYARRSPWLATLVTWVKRMAIAIADTIDHRKKRRTFPPELQGSDAPGGSEHPDNLRSLCHSCHSRRADDKARRAT